MDQIVDRLKFVAESQSLEYDTAALEFIAKTSEGGMRDALSIMDQAIAFGDERLTLQDALNVTGSVDEAALNDLFKDVVEGNVKEAFGRYHHFISEGKEVNRLINDMIYFVRDTIMIKTSNESNESIEYDALVSFELDTLYRMIDIINDTLVSIRFSVNQNVHFEVLLVKLAEMIKAQPQTVQNMATTAVATEPDNDVLLQRMEQLENELKTLKAQGVSNSGQTQQPKKPTRTVQRSKNAFSMQQIAKVLDKANKEDIKLLKDHWQEVIDHAKSNDKKSLVSLLQNSEPVAASEDHVLVKFEEEIHCEIVNKDDEKRNNIESVVCNIVNKTVKVVGVPSDQWLRVRSEYIQNRNANGENNSESGEAQQPAQVDVAQKAKDLFGEETVHMIDED